jgi:hypothetical protein
MGGGQVVRQKRWQRSIKAAGVLGGLITGEFMPDILIANI